MVLAHDQGLQRRTDENSHRIHHLPSCQNFKDGSKNKDKEVGKGGGGEKCLLRGTSRPAHRRRDWGIEEQMDLLMEGS